MTTLRRSTLFILLLASTTVALPLASCGGGGPSSSTSSPTSATSSAASKQIGRLSPREIRRAGRADRFLVPQGDNSVPTYGSEADGRDRRRAEGALAAYLHARSREDWPTACSYLAASLRRGLGRFAKASGGKLKGCGSILKLSAGAGLADPLDSGLVSLRVKGDHAFALWVGPGEQEYAMPMVREAGAWRVSQIAPPPYPPGSAR